MKTKTSWLVMVMVLLIACNQTPPENSKPEYTIIEQSKIIGDTNFFSIDLQYPSFVASKNNSNSNLETLNKSMETFLDTASRYFWGTDTEGARKTIRETGSRGKYELMNRYEILCKDVSLISVKFETYSYALGAHGFTALTTYNFDVKSGNFLKLTDLVNLDTPGNLQTLNNLLLKHFENPVNCFDKEPAVTTDWTKFGKEPSNLVFYFEAYELGPYSCGAATIKIPIIALKEAGIWKWKENLEESKTS